MRVLRASAALLPLLGSVACVSTAPAAVPDVQASIHAARDRVYPALVMIQASWDVYQGGAITRAGGSGSGTLIDPVGHVLTNFHVAGHADVIHCQLYNKEIVRAHLVGADPWTDLALLQLDMEEVRRRAPGATWAKLGHAQDVQVGDLVLAMGAPLGQARSVSFGVVSNTDRTLPEGFRLPSGEETGIFNVWFQTDASINPGNSGGPLVDLAGNVVGVNSREMPNADGIGFSVPIDIAKDVVYQILAHGRVRRSWIGLNFQRTQNLEGLTGGDATGALVRQVEPDSPAQAAGILPQDLIMSLDGAPVTGRFEEDLFELRRRIAGLPIGKPVELGVRRDGQDLVVRLSTKELGASLGEDKLYARWGLGVKEISDRMRRQMGLPDHGVFVTGVRGMAASVGLKPNDVLVRAGGETVDGLQALDRLYDRMAREKIPHLKVEVKRGPVTYFASLRLEPEKEKP